MLKKFRTRHIKLGLLVLLILIVPSFLFWGIASFLKGEKEKPAVTLDGKILEPSQIQEMLTTAAIYYRLALGENSYGRVTQPLLEMKAFQLILLLWKAQKEGIRTQDDEVISFIRQRFSPGGEFDITHYTQYLDEYLRLSPRMFEEHIRTILTAEKVLDEYIRNTIEIEDQEIRSAYEQENEKIKISYIIIPYALFDERITVSPEEISLFYKQNQNLFAQNPKVKIRYAIFDETTAKQTIDSVHRALKHAISLEELAKRFAFELKTSPFFERNQALGEFGNDTKINDLAFDLPHGVMSPLLKLENGYAIFEKIEEQNSRIASQEETSDDIRRVLGEEKKKQQAHKTGEEIIRSIAKHKESNMEAIAEKRGFTAESTGYLRRKDALSQIGFDEETFEMIAGTKKGEIYSSIILQPDRAIVVRIDDVTTPDDAAFTEEKEQYRQALIQQKNFIRTMDFISDLQKEARLERKVQ